MLGIRLATHAIMGEVLCQAVSPRWRRLLLLEAARPSELIAACSNSPHPSATDASPQIPEVVSSPRCALGAIWAAAVASALRRRRRSKSSLSTQWWVLVLLATVGCNSRGDAYQECPPGAACAAPCERGTPEICDELPCPEAGQIRVDLCENGYRPSKCECEDPGAGCAGLDCVAGTYCFRGECLKRFPCGDEVCEPGWSCMLSELCVQVLAKGQAHPGSMQLVGDTLYFANQSAIDDDGNFTGEASVQSVGIDSADALNLADSEEPVRKLTVDDEFVYYVRGTTDEQLMRVSRSGGKPTRLLDGLHVLDALVVDGERLYWFDQREGEPSVRLMSAAVSGEGEARQLWERSEVTRGPLVVQDRIYWIETEKTFWRSDLDGSDAAQVASSEREGERVRVMASEGDAFYFGWSDDHTSGVSVYDADSKHFERIGTDAHNDHGIPIALAVDDRAVYVQIYYPRSQQRTTALFRMQKTPKASRELSFLSYTDASVETVSQPVDNDSLYFRTPSDYPDPDGSWIVRIRKRW